MKLPPYAEYRPWESAALERLPVTWQPKRLRFCALVNPRSARLRELAPEDEVSFVPMEAVGEYGGLTLDQTRAITEVGAGYTEFDDGDVVVAKITPCFENGKGALAEGLVNGAAFGTTELHVLRASGGLHERFLFYLTISHYFRSAGEGEMYGAGGQKRVPPEFCKNVLVPLPREDEQRIIADFLDRETARIDALVAKKRTLIERLKEKRAALISRTVTRGLPPDAARTAGLDPHPKLKPSGIDWVGDVPQHWQVLPFTKYVSDKSDYRGKTPEKTTEGVVLVTARNVRMGFIDYETSKEYVAEEEYQEIMRRGLPKKGDILFTTEAPLGNVALVDREDIALAQRIIRFRMEPKRFHAQFALYAMMSDHFQVQLQSLSTGSTAEGLKASKLPLLRVVAPPIEEQRCISAFLEKEAARIVAIVGKVEAAIERLQERRAALVTGAVTGRIDVRRAHG